MPPVQPPVVRANLASSQCATIPVSYDNVVRGSLKLKAGVVPGGGPKKKGKKRRIESSEVSRLVDPKNNNVPSEDASSPTSRRVSVEATRTSEDEASSPNSSGQAGRLSVSANSELATEASAENISRHLTPAERAFQFAQRKRDGERTDKRLKMTHRQRMEQFNAHLATLSEHFDIPKVGPG